MYMDIMNLAPPLPQSYFLLIQYCKFGIHNFIKQPSFTIITLSYHHNLWHNKYISKYQNSMDKNKIEQELATNKIREGPLLKQSKFIKDWRQRWVVLTMNYIITFTNKTYKEMTDIMDLRTIKSYKSYTSQLEVMIPASFKIRSGDNSFYLCAKNIQEKWSWIVTLERLLSYKQSGPTPYNSLSSIKNKGFPSLHEYNTNSLSDNGQVMVQQLKEIEKKKQEIERESVNMAQKICQQKFEIDQERQKLKQQYKQLYKFRQTLQEQKSRLSSQEFEVSRATSPQSINNLEISQVNNETPLSAKQSIITNIFNQLSTQSNQFFGFRYYVDFLINICSDKRLCYQEPLMRNCEKHRNNKHFAKIFVEFLSDFEPTVLSNDGRGSTQIFSIALLSREMQYFENWIKMIYLLLKVECPIFEKKHLQKMNNKLKSFLLHDESDSTEQLKILLQAMIKMNKVEKFCREEVESRLQKIVKLSKKQQISSLAKNLLNEL